MSHHDMVVNAISAMLDEVEPLVTADCCIYKVPSVIGRLSDHAYTPKVISIGPFHHRHHHHPRLQNIERHKLIYFKAFLQRTDSTLQTLIHYIDSIIPNFRRCYSETLDFTDQELVKLILIDSGFIIEFFWRYYDHGWSQDDDFLLKPCDPLHKLKATLRRDYCSSPWQTAASIAGILLLILSLIQSVCSVLQVLPRQVLPK